jgi:hypothetical protein
MLDAFQRDGQAGRFYRAIHSRGMRENSLKPAFETAPPVGNIETRRFETRRHEQPFFYSTGK